MDELERTAHGYGWKVEDWHRQVFRVMQEQLGARAGAMAIHGILRHAEIEPGAMTQVIVLRDGVLRERVKPFLRFVAAGLGMPVSLWEPEAERDLPPYRPRSIKPPPGPFIKPTRKFVTEAVQARLCAAKEHAAADKPKEDGRRSKLGRQRRSAISKRMHKRKGSARPTALKKHIENLKRKAEEERA